MAIPLNTMTQVLIASSEVEPGIADPDLALWTLVVFCLLMGLLYAFAWGPICEALDKREEAIRNDLESAKANAEKARLNHEAYEAKLATAAQEANQIVAAAKEEAEHAKARIVSEGNTEAERLKERGLAEVETAKRAAVNDLAQSSVDNAVGLASRLINKSLDRDSHAQLIRESLDKFSQPK